MTQNPAGIAVAFVEAFARKDIDTLSGYTLAHTAEVARG